MFPSRAGAECRPCDGSLPAHLMLLTGDMEHGWNEFEWRWKAGRLTVREFDRPAWAGGSLEGKAILIHAEQGLGDTLQFIRYAAVVKSLGDSVVVECQSVLSKILSRCPGIDSLVPRGDKLPAFDFHAPMSDLARPTQNNN